MSKLRCEYIYKRYLGNPEHIWTCLGAAGAIHVWIRDSSTLANGQVYGGIEIHYRTPPDYMSNDAPSCDRCWLLKCPCWHDGSSVMAQEYWIPAWQGDPHDHDGMFRLLEREYTNRFAPTPSEACDE